MELKFLQVDVFTERALGGNPLAIFPDAAGLETAQMQAIARETNLSETTFITARNESNHIYTVRIFSPWQEMPFAGHPTLGTAWHIFRELDSSVVQLKLNLPAGLIPVRRVLKDPPYVYFEPPRAQLGPVVDDVEALCELIRLPRQELALDLAPAQQVNIGLSYIKIPLRGIRSLESAECDLSVLRQLGANFGFDQVTVYCMQGYRPESVLSTRMFAPLHGVSEDPATGSSAASLTHYLRAHNVIGDSGREWLHYDQGYSLNRPSLILARANKVDDDDIEVNIGGHVIEVARGRYSV